MNSNLGNLNHAKHATIALSVFPYRIYRVVGNFQRLTFPRNCSIAKFLIFTDMDSHLNNGPKFLTKVILDLAQQNFQVTGLPKELRSQADSMYSYIRVLPMKIVKLINTLENFSLYTRHSLAEFV